MLMHGSTATVDHPTESTAMRSCQLDNQHFALDSADRNTSIIVSIRSLVVYAAHFLGIMASSTSSAEAFSDIGQPRRSIRSASKLFESKKSTSSVSQQIMYNQQARQREQIHYHIIAAEATEPLARRMEDAYPDRFTFHTTKWKKFADGTDDIEISGFYPRNLISGQQVLFLASFHNNDVSLSQFQVMIALLQSFIEGVCIFFLSYYHNFMFSLCSRTGPLPTNRAVDGSTTLFSSRHNGTSNS
jgi:hypothetical protein